MACYITEPGFRQEKESAVTISHLFAGIAVADYAAGLAWYERLFGRPADVVVNDHEVMWQMIPGGWIYVVGDAGRAGRGLVTLLVDDLEGHLAALAGRGLVAGAIDILPGGARKATVTDPEGNVIGFGEVRGAGE
jgi:predicted enzyme related to lactoylglutathione lyase